MLAQKVSTALKEPRSTRIPSRPKLKKAGKGPLSINTMPDHKTSHSDQIEQTLNATRTQYQLLMAELKKEHGIAQLEKHSLLKRSTVNGVISNGAVPDMKFVLSIAKFMGVNFHTLNARLTGEPLPGARTGIVDRGHVLRDTSEFKEEIGKLPEKHRAKLLSILAESLAESLGQKVPEID